MPPSEPIVEITVEKWPDFATAIETSVYGQPGHHPDDRYIWRGQRRADWALTSSLERLCQRLGLRPSSELYAAHLEAFKAAARGRRGSNPPNLDENTWWALGQHWGLATPLLDWTRSPFAAAYFAFEDDDHDKTDHVAVYCLDTFAVLNRNKVLEEEEGDLGAQVTLDVFEPMSDENSRLVSQGGLFTRAPVGADIESWVGAMFDEASTPVLRRFLLPQHCRRDCLIALRRANLSHLSLFPDLLGASRYSNLRLELDPHSTEPSK